MWISGCVVLWRSMDLVDEVMVNNLECEGGRLEGVCVRGRWYILVVLWLGWRVDVMMWGVG